MVCGTRIITWEPTSRGHEIAYVLEVQAMHNFRVLVGTGALSDFEGVPLQ